MYSQTLLGRAHIDFSVSTNREELQCMSCWETAVIAEFDEIEKSKRRRRYFLLSHPFAPFFHVLLCSAPERDRELFDQPNLSTVRKMNRTLSFTTLRLETLTLWSNFRGFLFQIIRNLLCWLRDSGTALRFWLSHTSSSSFDGQAEAPTC